MVITLRQESSSSGRTSGDSHPMRRTVRAALASTALGAVLTVSAGVIPVPNGSFEAPETEYAAPMINDWETMPQPAWYDEEQWGGPWYQTTGVFLNAEPIKQNMDGDQGVFFFALPQVAIFQDYNSKDYSQAQPARAFDVIFEPGLAYELTVGVVGNGGGMQEGVALALQLYYLDEAGQHVTVSETLILNSPGLFGNRTHFVDFTVSVPEVRADDPWAGRHLGIGILSMVGFDMPGGYWDLDNVRLRSIAPPTLEAPVFVGGKFAFTIAGEPLTEYSIWQAGDLAAPIDHWTDLGTVTTGEDGKALFTDPEPAPEPRFYVARQAP